jgi:hypothetical protein
LLAFRSVEEKNNNNAEIKIIKIGCSDCIVKKVYEEIDGRLIDFLVQEDQLLVLTKCESRTGYNIKVYELNNRFKIKL